MNLSVRQLRAFVALVDEKNFTRAAQRCHLSQPAFSALIRAIEENTGVKLFDRTTRHVELTPEGEIFDVSARRLLADFEMAVDGLQDHVAKRKGRASVAALPSLAAGWVPTVLAEFQQRHPGIVLELHDALLEPCLALVRSGRVDFALAARGADMSDLETELLSSDAFYLVCRHDHPLAARRSVRTQDLQGYPFIQLAPSSSVRQRLESLAQPVQMNTAFEVEHLATVTGLVAAGLGISLVPAMTLFQFVHEQIAIVPLAGRGPTRSLYLVKRRGRSLSLAAQALYDLLLARRPDSRAGPARRRKTSRSA